MTEEADDDESNEICDDFMLDGYEASFCLISKKELLSKGKYFFVMHRFLIWAGTVKHWVQELLFTRSEAVVPVVLIHASIRSNVKVSQSKNTVEKRNL